MEKHQTFILARPSPGASTTGGSMTDSELIKRTAAEVMGWSLFENQWYFVEQKYTRRITGFELSGKYKWNPITDANHWKMVIEKLQSMGYKVEIRSIKENIGREVCLAALEAMRYRDQTATNGKNIPDNTGT